MNKLFQLIMIVFLLFPRQGISQGIFGESPFGKSVYTAEPVQTQTLRVYRTDYGIPQVVPSYKIVQNQGITKVYEYEDFMVKPLPVLKIMDMGDFYKVTELENGIPKIWAQYFIKIE